MKKALIPTFYKDFSCIGPACEDTCCKGWQVTIDEKTFKKYRKLSHSPIKNVIIKSLKRNRSNPNFFTYGSIKLEKGACPLLTEEGFCSVHTKLGSEYLSHTCSTYPRQFREVENLLEISTTLSCPETARLALLNKNGIRFEETEYEDVPWSDYAVKQTNPLIWLLRIAAIRLLQNRSTSIENRLITLGLFLQKVDSTTQVTSEEFEQLVAQYEARLTSEAYLQQLSQLPLQTKFQLKIITTLANERGSVINERFNQCMLETIEALQLDQEISNEEKIEIYKQAATQEYISFTNEHEYMLENYLVNHVFKELFPFDEKTLFESFRKMVTYFILIKFQLIGMAKYHKELTIDDAIRAFQSFARTTEHNAAFVQKALKVLEEQGITTIGSLVTLIRH